LKSVQGHFHQADCYQLSIDNAGKQCVANAACSLMYSSIILPYHWEPNDVDNILLNGDNLYTNINVTGYLTVSQLPKYINCFSEHFYLQTASEQSIILQEEHIDYPYVCLSDALEQLSHLTMTKESLSLVPMHLQ
jgi:hypothetical protein